MRRKIGLQVSFKDNFVYFSLLVTSSIQPLLPLIWISGRCLKIKSIYVVCKVFDFQGGWDKFFR